MRVALLIGLVIGVLGCGGRSKGNGGLKVTGTPTGKVEGQVRVVLAFDKPMVKPEQVNQPLVTTPVKIDPAFTTNARWIDDKTLVVMPTVSLPLSTKYVVTVPDDTKALDGSSLGDDQKFEFFTQRLDGTLEIVGSKTRAKRDAMIKLTFNQEVPLDQVTKYCSYGDVGVKLAPDNGPGPSKSYTLVPASELATNTEYTATCKADLKGAVGNLGLEQKLEDKLKTYGPLKFISMTPNGDDIVPEDNQKFDLAFSNPLAEPYQLKITPAVPGFPQRCHDLGEDPAGVSCNVQLDAHTRYTITVDAAQKDAFGQTLAKAESLAFSTTDAEPTVSMESGYYIAELKRPLLPVWTRNVKELEVGIVDVTPATFHELRPMLDWYDDKPIDLKGTKLVRRDKKVTVSGEKNKWGQRPLDPAELLGRKAGPGMYYVELGASEVKREPFANGGRDKVLINFTDIGVVTKLSPTRGLVWATTLSTGKPLPGASVSVRDGNGKVTWSGTTDDNGIAILPPTSKLQGAAKREPSEAEGEEGEGGFDEGPEMRLYVQKDADWTMINPFSSNGLSPWSFSVSTDYDSSPVKLRGFMHTDRGLYRPGEKVHVKGLARTTKLGEPLSVPTEGKKVKVEVEGPQGKTVFETDARLSAFGGFWFDIDLPEDARLGDYSIRARLENGTFTREFSVENYRPATFEVTGKASQSRVIRRGNIEATVAANYLYGAPVRSGDVAVTVHSRPRRVDFKQHEAFSFVDERRYDYYYDESQYSQTLVTEANVSLDQKGNATASVAVSPNDVSTDADLLIRADVTAPSNEVISKTFTVPYFRYRKYFGIKAPAYFLELGKPEKFQIISVTPDGKVLDGPAKVSVTRRDWNCVWEDWGYRGSYQCKEKKETLIEKTVQLTGGQPAEIEIDPKGGGEYWITVEGDSATGSEAAPAAMQLYAWGDGGGSWRSSDTLSYDIVTDKKEYKPGDTATLLLKTDLSEASGLVTIERDGVIETKLIEVTPTKKHVEVPITASYAPNIYVSVALVQKRMGDGPRGKPRMRMGLVNLPVRSADDKLTVSIETDKKDYRPGTPVTATVKVTDPAGNPVSAEVSLTAADEGVLSLIGYETPNPIPTFYAPWGIGVTSATQLEYIRDIPGPNVDRPATGGDSLGSFRSRFASTAVWAPAAVTNANGIATVKFQAPDNLTAFRVMALAADKGHRFGSSDQRFTVSKPLQLHQALPRFLNQGDELDGGVIVHNETGKAGTATVKLVGDPRIAVSGGTERTVQIAKDAQVPVLFKLAAKDLGEATLGFSVTMNGESDAVQFKLPVQHPSPVRVQHLAHGSTKDATTIPVALPPDAIPESAELVISVDPDGLSGIDNGLRELVGYPYGCLEQTTSKVIPMIAVRELADSLGIAGLTGDKLEGFVKAGIAKIGRHQTTSGGFSLWPGGEPETYYTAYALWGLSIAKQAGYAVDAARISDGLDYLKGEGKSPDTSRPYYNEAGNLGSQAFALYVRATLGDKDTAAATTLLANAKLPYYGKAFVARAIAADLGAKDPAVQKLVGELAQVALAAAKADQLIQEPDDKFMYGYMSSSLRSSAIVLAALVELDSKNEAVKALVRVLMKQRRDTDVYWDTQENLYSLLALASYAKAQSQQAPSIEIKLADKTLVQGPLTGKQRMRIVTTPVTAGASLQIEPKGEVAYNIEIRHRKTLASIKEEHHGIVLRREYLDEAGNAKTSFTVGDVVLVRLTTQKQSDGHHLMVSDPLPAGFEALNTRFATVGTAGIKQTDDWGVYREMYDNRVDFATEYSYSGNRVQEYMIRAIAPGKFARPPSVAELMYDPATNSRLDFEMIEVKAK